MPFKVLIVGGSITGLTLAAILERYGIDYTLLEKHENVTPSIGASIGLLAHGSRVLDQLGCFEELLPFGTGVQDMAIHGPDGKLLGAHARLGTHLDTMLGYRIFFVERQRVLLALWTAIKDKSKIYLSCEVARIEHSEGGVQVETKDGRIFTGSIIVGGDGVHSRTRNAMWRLMAADKCDPISDRKKIRSACSCIFGISYGLTQVQTETWKHAHQDRHYLCSGAPNGLTFWFLFFKNCKLSESGDSLQYTEQEKEEYAAEFSTDQVRPDLTFGDMYRAATSTVLVPIEEFVLKRCYYKRILLLGDAAHKMHPVTGQGGNAAIEDSTFLGNRLKDLLQNDPSPSDSQIQLIFHEIQEERRPRTEMLAEGAHGLARIESFGNPLLKLMMLHMFPTIPGEKILAGLAESMTQGQPLKYLPLPVRSKGLLPYDDEIQFAPKYRSTKASYVWIGVFLLIGSLRFIIPATLVARQATLIPPICSSAWKVYIDASYFAVNAVWLIESYRSAFGLGPLLTPIPWILLAQFFGWEIALPVYFVFWILGSSFRGFYYPWPRAILSAAAQAFPAAVILFGPHSIWTLDNLGEVPYFSKFTIVTLVHLLIPVFVGIVERRIADLRGPRWEPVYQFGDHDIKNLTQFFFISILVTGIGHVPFILMEVIPTLRQGAGPLLLRTPEIVNFGIFTTLIVAWLLFTVWDLRRVRIVNLGFGTAALYIFLGISLLGPGATLMGAWWWREKAWERSRQRRSEERYAEVKLRFEL